MPYVTVDGCRLFYQWEGAADAPVLLLSHSLGSDLTMWDRQIPVFSQHLRVLRYDSRGHGRSETAPGPYTIERLGRDAAVLIETLGLESVAFGGLSMGGMVGMWLGVNAPHLLRRLVLANTSSKLGPRSAWDERIRAVTSSGMSAVADAVITRWFTPEFTRHSPAEVDRCRALLLSTPVEGYAACCAALRDMDQSGAMSRIAPPTLVIVGDRDPATPPSHGEEIAAAIAGAQLVRLPAAHLSNIEAADAFNVAVLRYLQ